MHIQEKENQEEISPMEGLIAGSNLFIPTVGDILEGTVLEKTSNSMLLDLGLIGTGVVYGAELKDGMGITNALIIGDSVKATLVDLENDEGYLELSVRQASYNRAWEDLIEKKDRKESIPTRIVDANKGGLLTELNGITGFLPVSQLSNANYPRVENGDKNRILELLKKLVGQELRVRILDCDKDTESLL